MNGEERRGQQNSIFEKHLQTGIQIILVAMLMWAGVQLVAIGQQTVLLEERMANQAALLSELRTELRRLNEVFVRRSEAERDLNNIERRIKGLDDRLSSLEEDGN